MHDQPNSRARGHVPVRPNVGIRRTTSIDVAWPRGRRGGMKILGRGRDVLSLSTTRSPSILASEELSLEVSADRTVLGVIAKPERESLSLLVGPGQDMRSTLRELRQSGNSDHPITYQLADDMPSVMVVADWAWSCWPNLLDVDEARKYEIKLSKMEGVCIGFRPGSSALHTKGEYERDTAVQVQDLKHSLDPDGWHSMPEMNEVSLRRVRCLDIWTNSNVLEIESYFQDSGTTPDGGRRAVHEYAVRAQATIDDYLLREIQAFPYVLPFPECHSATEIICELVGHPLHEFRTYVPELLGRTRGCTHLNDALRSLADVPVLAQKFKQMLG